MQDLNDQARNTKVTHILGAGPAGLTAAITLARAGRKVTVYERASDVGSRHDGDYEVVENWTTHEDVFTEFSAWGVNTDFHCVPINALTCFGPGFQGMERLEATDPLFYVIQRGSQGQTLDCQLLRQARAAGVNVEFRCNLKPEQADIVATGFAHARGYGVGYNFTTKAPNACYICFDAGITPNFYSYLITCEGRGTIAFGSLRPSSPNLKDRLDYIVAGFRSRVDFDMESPRYFIAASTFGLPRNAQRHGRLYVGEAAELQDPLFGFGLRMSMMTGHLAARSLLDDCDYDSLWRARLVPQLRAAAVHRLLIQMTGNLGYRLLLLYVRLYARSGNDLFAKHYRPMWYTHLLWPLAKYKLLADLRNVDQHISKRRFLRNR